jgi:hypothetical protein
MENETNVGMGNASNLEESLKLEKKSEGSYPREVLIVLTNALKNVFDSIDDVAAKKIKEKKIYVVLTDDLYEKRWVLDLTNWKHPNGIGPTAKSLGNKKDMDITYQFNKITSHGNDELIKLLSLAIGCIKD